MTPDQALPSFNRALNPDHYKTILPNLSYPSRPITHTPWSGPSVPLLFSKTTRPEMAIAASSTNVQVPIPTTANTSFHTSSLVPDAFHGVAQVVNDPSKTQNDQAKALWRVGVSSLSVMAKLFSPFSKKD